MLLLLRPSCRSYAVWRTFKQMDRGCVIPTFTLKTTPGLKIAAGDTPSLCTDLVLIRSNSRAGCWVLCEHKYLEKHDKQSRGGEDLEKKYQALGNTRGECFSENLRHCWERGAALLTGGAHFYFWSAHKHAGVENGRRAAVTWRVSAEKRPFSPTSCLKAPLTLHTRAMRDTRVLSKKSNSFPTSLKKK